MVRKILTKFEVNRSSTSEENWGRGGGENPPSLKSDTADPNSEVEIGLKDWWVNFHPLLFFQNSISWKEGKALVFCDFYYYHQTNFSWKFNRNCSYHSEDFKIVFVNINYFYQFLDFLTFLVASKLIMSSYNRWCHDFFFLQPTSNNLFNNCIKLSWYWICSSWNMIGNSIKMR